MKLNPYMNLNENAYAQAERTIHYEIEEHVQMMKVMAEHHLSNTENDFVREYAEAELHIINQMLEELKDKRHKELRERAKRQA